MNKYTFDKTYPQSWSSFSSFEYDKEQWFKKYILKEKPPVSAEMQFGKEFAKALEDGKPMAPMTVLTKAEHKFEVVFNGIPLVGYVDAINDRTFKEIGEYKTSKNPWTQKKVDEHGQLDMYLLMNYITNKIPPEKVKLWLEAVLTEQTGDFQIRLKQPVEVQRFNTKRTMNDILNFGMRITRLYKEMEQYTLLHS